MKLGLGLSLLLVGFSMAGCARFSGYTTYSSGGGTVVFPPTGEEDAQFCLGTLTVNLLRLNGSPLNAGRWRFVGETIWRANGARVIVPGGTYQIEFKGVFGSKPGKRSVRIECQENKVINVSYPPVR